MKAQAPPAVEKYDWARTQGPDPRDERTLGSPCYGKPCRATYGQGFQSVAPINGRGGRAARRVGFACPTHQHGAATG